MRFKGRYSIIGTVLFCLAAAHHQALSHPMLGAADSVQQDSEKVETSSSNDWTQRRIVGAILSVVIPGSGQSYLGYTEKGAAFTIATFGSALVAGLSQSNVVGRNERLDELKALYAVSTSYIGADSIWNKMVETKSILDADAKRRDLFLKLTVAVWVANLLDYLFLTENRGEKTFGFLPGKENSIALVPDPKNGVHALLRIRF